MGVTAEKPIAFVVECLRMVDYGVERRMLGPFVTYEQAHYVTASATMRRIYDVMNIHPTFLTIPEMKENDNATNQATALATPAPPAAEETP